MTETELCEVVITAPDPGWLKDFSRKLVEQQLCASAHNFTPVQSIYRWRGDIYERTEGRVSLHTRRDRVAEIVALAKQEHPYEVPGISTRTITDGNPEYLAWIAQETRPNGPTGKDGKKGTGASAQQGATDGGVHRDGKPGPSAHRRSPEERDALEARRADRLSSRWSLASADGSEP